MELTPRVRLFSGLLALAAVVAAGWKLADSARSRAALRNRLRETREVWEALEADRYGKLKLGVRVLGNDPAFKAAIATDQATVFDMLRERGQDLGADFFIATDPAGIVIARSDRPTAQGEDLSQDPVVMKPLDGEESSTVWRQGDRLYHAVSVPMAFGQELVGVLVAGYGIDETFANQVRKITNSQVAFLVGVPGGPPRLSVSSLGAREGALKAVLGRPELDSRSSQPFEIDLEGERHIGIQVPLKSAAGQSVGSVVFLRSLAGERTPLPDRPRS